MQPGHREEVLNTVLATALATHALDADPETILKNGRVRPDVMAKFRGLRCAIEGKIDDTPQAHKAVLEDAQKRIDQGVAHIAIAVVYTAALRTTEFASLGGQLASEALEFAVLTEADTGGWHRGGITEIAAELRRAHDVIVRDDVLQQAVDTLNLGMAGVADALLGSHGACDRLISLLGVGNKSSANSAV